MKLSMITFFVCLLMQASGQYTHPTVGIQYEYVGNCLVANCGPTQYTDNGNVGGNYANGINLTYRVFCPSIAGRCMRATFNSFRTEGYHDFLEVKNGPTQNSPNMNSTQTSTNNAYGVPALSGNLATPFSFTSTDASGCLTFRFRSDGSVNYEGWVATLSCVPCANGPSGTSNSDCLYSTAICSNASITSMANGPGIVAEGCNGSTCPAGGENHSNWYRFVAQSSGYLNISINPAVSSDDYDFAIYGPNVSCGALGAPIRCTDSGNSGITAATGTSNGNTHNVTGNGYVNRLDVLAGQSYYLVVDKWSPSGGTGYTLSFSGTASLNCLILPIELSLFEATYEPSLNVVDLTWVTQSEFNVSHFELERSIDGVNYQTIAKASSEGNTTLERQYFAMDRDPHIGVNYYRLKQFDLDGNSRFSTTRSVNVLDTEYDVINLFPNPTNGLMEVIFNSYSTEGAVMRMEDASGMVVSIEELSVVKGGNRLNLDLSSQSDGLYFLTIITKHKTLKTKIIKQ